MHDGTIPYPGVLDVIQKLRQANKELIILSNSSKRKDNSIKVLTKLGFNPLQDFTKIITSGEVSYQLLRQVSKASTSESSATADGSDDDDIDSDLTPQPWSVLADTVNNNVFCLGSGDDDEEYIQSCGWKLSTIDEASLIVARGTFAISDGSQTTHKKHDGENAYETRLQESLELAANRQLPMIVCNPDKIRPDSDRSPMPGQIGDAYERELQKLQPEDSSIEERKLVAENLVKRIGKPFSDVYEIALRGKSTTTTTVRACMIGDALETDVTGGTLQNIDTVWVINDGIHNVAVEERLEKIGDESDADDSRFSKACSGVVDEFNQQTETYAKGRQLRPTMIVPHFRW